MALKKQQFAEGEIAIFDEACIYKRGEYWQFRMWLPKENKYARKSLRTRSEATAIEKGKAAYLEIYANLQQGKSYFSITTKEGVEKYLSFRKRDVELGHIVKGRHTTIATHLMKSYDELKAEMEAIQQQMVEAKKNERANALKEVKRLCKEFGFTAGMLKGSLAEGRKTKGASL